MSRRSLMFVLPSLDRGGTETQVLRLSGALVQRGWRVSVVSMLEPRALRTELEARGVCVEVLPGTLGRPGCALGLGFRRRVLRHRPAVIVGMLFHANNLVRLHGPHLRVPGVGAPAILTSIRSETFGPRWRETCERLVQRRAIEHAVVTNAARVADRLAETGVVPRERLRVIGNAIEVERYLDPQGLRRDAMRRELGLTAEDFAWLCVANLRPVKDHPTLLRAFARARHRHPRGVLLLAGAGEPAGALAALATELGLGPHLRWLGPRTDVPKLLAAADALVLSSRHEGLPNAVLEALAAGRPVVSTDVGGVRELVTQGQNGQLVPPGDPEALGDAMAAIMALDPARRRELGAQGQAHARANYDLPAVVDAWEALFEAALRAGGRTAP